MFQYNINRGGVPWAENLAALKTKLSHIASAFFLEETSPKAYREVSPAELPFPPEVVMELTRKDISAFQKVVGGPARGAKLYSPLARLYIEANTRYSPDTGQEIVAEMRRCGVLVPLSFFLLMHGAAAQRDWAENRQKKQAVKCSIRWVKSKVPPVERAIKILVDFVGDNAQSVRIFDHDYSYYWVEHPSKRAEFLCLLENLEAWVKMSYGRGAARWLSPLGKPSDISPSTVSSYEALYELARQAKKKYDRSSATLYNPDEAVDRLFDLAGVKATRGAQKMRKSRSKILESNKPKK